MWGQFFVAAVAAAAGSAGAAGWSTAAVSDGRNQSCVTTSAAQRAGGAEYQVMISFGDRNAIALRTNRPIAPTRRIVLHTPRGDHPMVNVQLRRDGARYVADNPVSNALFRAMLADLRVSPSAALKVNGADYPLPMGDFGAAVDSMIACSRNLRAAG